MRVDAEDGSHQVDTGFIVFNEERYPSFVKLLRRLGVESQASSMSFSVRCDEDGLEYSNRSLFAQFFTNHRFLDIFGQPEWRVVRGGSSRYVEKLTAGFRDRIRLSSPVTSIRRAQDHVLVTPRGGAPERFDEVIVAAHADQALAMLDDASPKERELLGSFRFQENVAVLHTDTRLMPRRKRAWACWNANVPVQKTGAVSVTYDMNQLQSLTTREAYLVTLNRTEDVDPRRVLRTIRYHHPVYSREAVLAQARHAEISGTNRTHFCGAYWGFGFHEDGVTSGLAVARHFGQEL